VEPPEAQVKDDALRAYLDKAHKEAFPNASRHDRVDMLLKMMFLTKTIREAFEAGWAACASTPDKGES